jgi:hypothetical protein
MRRHLALGFAAALLSLPALVPAARGQTMPPASQAYRWSYVGPQMMLFAYADSTLALRAKQWNTDSTNDYEKMLWVDIKMRFWRDHLPDDMRFAYDALGYPSGRVLLTPVGHKEELWYYSQHGPPLRFRDGVLMNRGVYQALTSRRRF